MGAFGEWGKLRWMEKVHRSSECVVLGIFEGTIGGATGVLGRKRIIVGWGITTRSPTIPLYSLNLKYICDFSWPSSRKLYDSSQSSKILSHLYLDIEMRIVPIIFRQDFSIFFSQLLLHSLLISIRIQFVLFTGVYWISDEVRLIVHSILLPRQRRLQIWRGKMSHMYLENMGREEFSIFITNEVERVSDLPSSAYVSFTISSSPPSWQLSVSSM